MNLDIKLGLTPRNTWRIFKWDYSAGMLIAGNPGTGKSQTATFYITQFAAKGAKIILGEYSAYSMKGEGLVDRSAHIRPAYYLPPAQTGDMLVEYIEQYKELADIRLDPVKGKTVDHFPIVFVIDEFSALMLDYQKQIPIEKLRSMSMTMRKVNMRMIIIGQSWAMLGRQVPQLRAMLDQTIIHRLAKNNAEIFVRGSQEVTDVMRLKPGYVMKDGEMMYIPSALRDNNLELYRQRIAEMHNNPNHLLEGLLTQNSDWKAVEVPSRNINIGNMEGTEVEVIRRIKDGQSNYKIAKDVYNVSGGRKLNEIIAQLDKIRAEYNGE